MKKFLITVLVVILTSMMVPISAATIENEVPEVIEPRYEVTSLLTLGFNINDGKAILTTTYIGKSNFSHISIYRYIEKNVSGSWVKPRTDIACSWSGTYYAKDDVIIDTLPLNSRGTYRGRVIAYTYGTDGNKDKINDNRQAVY